MNHAKMGDLVSISSMFYYKQILCTKIPKTKKNTVKPSVFFALLGSTRVKAAGKALVKSTPGVISTKLNIL
jgi:hypothetical protein